jgi:hypothetical protein
MKIGDLVKNRWDGSYLPVHEKPHGIIVTKYLTTEIGIILDFYSNTGVPYIQILTPGGTKGWVRYQNVEVLK